MAYDITGARLNGPRKRVNKIARAVLAELQGTSTVHSRARLKKASPSRKAGRKTRKSARKNPLAALMNPVSALAGLFNPRKKKSQKRRRASTRQRDATGRFLALLGAEPKKRKGGRKAKAKASSSRTSVRRSHRHGLIGGLTRGEAQMKRSLRSADTIFDPVLGRMRRAKAGEYASSYDRYFKPPALPSAGKPAGLKALPPPFVPPAPAGPAGPVNITDLRNAVAKAMLAKLGAGNVTPAMVNAKVAQIQQAAATSGQNPLALVTAFANPRKAKRSVGSVSDAQIQAAVKKFVGKFTKAKNLSHAEKVRLAPELFQRNDGKIFGQLLGKHALKAGDASTRLLRQRVKRAVAKELGLDPKSVLAGKGRHYKVKEKKSDSKMKGAFGRGVTAVGRAVPRKPVGMRASEWYKKIGGKEGYRRLYEKTDFGKYKAARVMYRDEAKGFDKKSRKWKSSGERTSGAILSGRLAPLYAELGVSGPHIRGDKSASRKGRKGRGSHPGVPSKELSAMSKKKRRGARRNVSALQNPVSALGTSALMNPEGSTFGAFTSYLTGYAVPVAVAGGAAGAVHAFAASKGVTEKVAEYTAKVPVVGTFVSERLPYSMQGLLVGSGLAILAPMVGGEAGKYLALTGGAALVVGGGIDAFNYMQSTAESAGSDLVASEEEAADATGALAFGDLAFERGLGDLAFGDLAFEGKANPFQAASLSAPALGHGRGDSLADMYGQASFADAHYSGADFSAVEGQALMNGSDAWCSAFGNPSVRMSGKSTSTASHHAGREGHRWGWLFRCIGTERARRIAALPPAQRLRVLAKLRKAAVKAYDAAMRAEKASAAAHAKPLATPHVLPAAGAIHNGALGAMGAGAPNMDYLGDPVVFMGA